MHLTEGVSNAIHHSGCFKRDVIGRRICFCQAQIKTPNIGTLAKQGTRYTQCYAWSTVCSPSRCGLMTGMHMGHATIRGNFETLPEGQYPLAASGITMAEVLKAAGYSTGLVG